jgi:hypothetical protein
MHGAVTQWLELTAVIPARDRDEQWTVATAAEESASIHAYTAVQQRDAAVLLAQALTGGYPVSHAVSHGTRKRGRLE